MNVLLALLLASAVTSTHATASPLQPGSYRTSSGHSIYVGPQNERPDPVVNEYFDPVTQRFGTLDASQRLAPQQLIGEDRRVIETPHGVLGVSLYYADSKKRATVILIHGNDPETREMGYLIPYFVLSGLNVISYDQRGTGESAGNWQLNGPMQRADDVEAVYDAYLRDAHVDAHRIGVFGFSNGGWTAPIVAAHRRVAFMLLKSAPAETIEDNLYYEIRQSMERDGYSAAVPQAFATWRALLAALRGTGTWDAAKAGYDSVKNARWFDSSLVPPIASFPPPTEFVTGFKRALSYDPDATLRSVKAPTLAIFGRLDRSVDAGHAANTMRTDFTAAGMTDLTIRMFPNAGHQLLVTSSGFRRDSPKPVRFAPGYPSVMIDWLRERAFLR